MTMGDVRVAQCCEASQYLVGSLIGNTDSVISCWLIQFDHGGVTFAVVHEDGVGRLRLNVGTVYGVDPHGVFID